MRLSRCSTTWSKSSSARSNVDAKGRPVTMTELLEKASTEVGRRFAEQPLLEARFQMVLAETHAHAGGVVHHEAARRTRLAHGRSGGGSSARNIRTPWRPERSRRD